MATPTDTTSTYDAVGNREDLSNVIYDISPTTTPFISGIPRTTATATNHEWQTDTLGDATGATPVIEGSDERLTVWRLGPVHGDSRQLGTSELTDCCQHQ